MRIKSALVTGASQGLGLSLCKLLLNRGCSVVALDYKISDELRALAGESLQIIRCDISNDEDVETARAECGLDSLDTVFNNAGVWLEKGRKKLMDDGFEFYSMLSQFNVNAVGMLRIVRAFMPLLLAGDNKVIVNVSSEAGSIGSADRACEYGYCMSKAAQNMSSKLLSNAFSKDGIKVYAVHPGWMTTPMGHDGATENATPNQSPDESARAIVELAEGERRNGIYYDIDGKEMPW